MTLTLMLTIILLFLSILVVFTERNDYLVVLSAFFSFCAATLYLIHASPDLALAEVAVGCAVIPLIYTISIARQNVLNVVFFDAEDQSAYCDPGLLLEFMGIAEAFCQEHGLKLKVKTYAGSYAPTVRGIFRPGNTDLIANYFQDSHTLMLWGNDKNQLVARLEDRLVGHPHIQYRDAEPAFFID